MKVKQCHKCNKETKLAFKCDHCGSIQQFTIREQLDFFKGLSNIKKSLYIGALVIAAFISFQIFSSSGSSSSSSSLKESNPDVCRCLTEPGNTKWAKANKITCRDAISNEIGVSNWEQVNFSQNPTLDTQWDRLKASCGY